MKENMDIFCKAENKRILVVDDSRSTRTLISRILAGDNYELIEADNGKEALEIFEREEIDMILLDIYMPIMDGLTACRMIRSHSKGKRVPILIFTGVGDSASVEAAFGAGADDFVTKPINKEELKYRVNHLHKNYQLETDIHRYINYDLLTGLPNRELFKDSLSLALAKGRDSGKMVAVITTNIKNFNLINDAFGYAEGDKILIDVAERLSKVMDKEFTIARTGGNDFSFIFSELENVNEVMFLADKIYELLEPGWYVNNQEIKITIDMGIAMYPNDAQNGDQLFKNAETAMRRSVTISTNKYSFYNHDMNSRALEHLTMDNSLRHAIKNQEFVIHYQSKIHCCKNCLTGVEALVRWQHPEKGLLPPMQFIPIAEENGLIIELGEWVIQESCRQVKLWHDLGHKLSLAVNISARQFQDEGLIEKIEKILDQTGFDANYLKIEITESIAMSDVNYTITVLNKLRELGVGVSIDDFGTGYSSLSYLKRLPINELKIDRSFVRDINIDREDTAIVDIIILLGKALDLNIVAEGVEEDVQLDFLRERECTEIQGYIYSAPLAAAEFEKKYFQTQGQ